MLACELCWHPDHARRIATANEAVTVARRTGDPTTLLFAILRPGGALMVPETSEQRVRLFREAAELATRVNDPIARADAILMLAPALLERASGDLIDEEFDAAVQVAAEIREPFMRWITRTVQGCLAIAHGDLEQGEKDTIDALQIARDGGLPDTEAAYDQQLFIIRWHQGRLAEVLDHVRDVGALVPGATAWPELPMAEAICGDRQRARTMLDDSRPGRLQQLLRRTVAGRHVPVGGRCRRARRAELRRDPLRKAGSLEGPVRHRRTRSHPRRQPLSRTARRAAGKHQRPQTATSRTRCASTMPCDHRSAPPKPQSTGANSFSTATTNAPEPCSAPPCNSPAATASVTSSGALIRPSEPLEQHPHPARS